jgi:DNA-binding transcriptional regulator Cro
LKPIEVLKFYGSKYNFHKQTGISRGSLFNWINWGYIPEGQQYKIERLTNGILKAEWMDKND